MRRGRTPATERIAVFVIVAAGGVVATQADASVSGWDMSDALWRAAFVVVLALAGSRARRWSWIVAATSVALPATSRWAILATLAVLVGSASVLDRKPRRWVGALVGATVGLVALHVVSDVSPLPAAVSVLVATGALVGSGHRNSPAKVRSATVRVVSVCTAVWVVGALLLGAVALLARGDIDAGTAAAADGLDTVAGSGAEGPAARLSASSDHFESAASLLDTWYVAPVRALPFLGPQARAMGDLSSEGAAVTHAAADAIAAARIDELRLTGGRVDIDRLTAAAPAFARLDEALIRAQEVSESVSSPWLVAPLADRVQLFEEHASEVAPAAHAATVAAQELPAILGGEGDRSYLVLFTTPAESRGAGGFTGSWGLVGASNGKVELVDQGRAADVNETPGREDRVVTGPEDYVSRYGRFRPGHWFQDTTFSPDVPSSSMAAAEVFGSAGLGDVDGVIIIDPFGLAALLELSGPVEVEGMDVPLTAENAVQFLLIDQYLDHGRGEREDVLADAGSATFAALLESQLPGPRRLGDVLGPVVRDGRISVTLFDEGGTRLVDELDLGRAFPRPDGADMAGLVTQNGGNNKADVFLHRQIDYQASVDPATGRVEAVAEVVLRNEAPSEGLPDAFLGSNDRGLPPGTNRSWVSWYTPLDVREVRLDGQAHHVEYGRELGWNVMSTYVEIPPGGEVSLEIVLTGEVEPGSPYRVIVPHQPLVNSDEVSVQVRPVPGWSVVERDGVSVVPGGAGWRSSSSTDAKPRGELAFHMTWNAGKP